MAKREQLEGLPELSQARRGVGLGEAAAGIPLSFSIVVLPFMFGGRYPGWLTLAQVLTFFAAAFLCLTGQLRLPGRGASRQLVSALGALAVAAGISAVFSPAPGTSYPIFLEWLWLGSTGILALFLARRARGRELLAGLLLVSVFLQVFWAFYLWWGSRSPTHEQAGTFYAPNQYAGYVLLLAPLLVALFLTSRSRVKAAGAGFVAAYLYLGVALSGSRAGVGAAALGLLAAVVITCRQSVRRTLLRTVVFVAALVALGLVMTSPLLFHSVAHLGSTGAQGVLGVKGVDPASLVMRLRWDLAASRMGISHPLTGTGLGTFGAVLLKTQNPSWQWSLFAHNQYLEAFAEGGLLLFGGMVAQALVPILHGARALWRGWSGEQPWRLGLWAGLVGGSAHLALDHDWSYPAYAATFVIVAVLVVAPWDRGGEDRTASLGRGWRRAIAGVAALCVLLVTGSYFSGRLVQASSASNSKLRLAASLAPYSSAPVEKLGQRLAPAGGRGDLVQAAALLRSAIRRNGLSPSLRWELADVYARLGDVGSARRTYAETIQIVPGAPNAYTLAATFELDTAHDPARAARLLDEGIARLRQGAEGDSPVPALVGLLTARANVEEQVAGASAALVFSQEATQIGPQFPKLWLNLHDFACRAGAIDVARQAGEKAAALGGQPSTGSC